MIIDNIYNSCQSRKQFWVLIDPDKQSVDEACEFAVLCEKNGVDLLLVGTSLMLTDCFEETR